MNNYIFVDFLNKGYSHFFFNTSFINKYNLENSKLEFYTYEENFNLYNKYFEGNENIKVIGLFSTYNFLNNNLNYIVNGMFFFIKTKYKTKNIILLATEYTLLPIFLYIFRIRNVYVVLHQVRFVKTKNLIKSFLWKILLNNRYFKFILLSKSQLLFINRKYLSTKSCLVFFHPF